MPPFPELLFSAALRFAQGLAMAAPTLLIGLFLAGVLRGVVGPERIRRLFGGVGSQGLVRASLWATLTPVCSIGVLPIVRELRRAGVPAAPLMTYLLSAPMLNPITLVYGWTILDPPVFFLLVLVTLAVSWGVGAVTGRWAVRPVTVNPAEWPQGEWGLKRMANIFIAASRSMAETGWADLLLAVGVSAVVAALQPTAWMRPFLSYTDFAAPWAMLVAAPLAFIDPYIGLMQVWAISSVRFSLAAATVLHVFGVGLNAAVLAWVARLYGGRRLLSLGVIVLVVTLAVGYAADAALPHPSGLEEDTHALDTLTRPYEAYAVSLSGSGWRDFFKLAYRHVQPVFLYSIGGVAAAYLCGLVLRLRGTQFFTGDVATAAARAEASSVWGQAIPARWLAAISLAGLLGMLVLMAYIYFPPAPELFEEMQMARTSAMVAVNTQQPEIAQRELERLEGLLGKLPTSLALRGAKFSEPARTAQQSFQGVIRELRDAVARQEHGRAKDLSKRLFEAAVACRESCLEGAGT